MIDNSGEKDIGRRLQKRQTGLDSHICDGINNACLCKLHWAVS